MKIAIASIGRFHMLDLARQMIRLEQEVKLFSGYPKLKIDKDLRQISESNWFWSVATHLRYQINPIPTTTWWYDKGHEFFSNWLSKKNLDVDVLDALSGVGLIAGRKLQQLGKVWICNRGSAHILTQKELLEKEHRIWKLPPPFFDLGKPMSDALAEYDEADAIVVPSTWAKETFIKQGISKNKVEVIPYGVDLSLFKPYPKQDSKFRVLFVGTFSAQKGIGYLLEAVRPLVEKKIVEVWLIGAQDLTSKPILDKYSEIFIDKGFIPRKDLSWYYSQGNVLVIPSIQDGLALVQAQAMSCGLPVIASTNTGANDLFTDGEEGFIVPIRSPEAIRDRLQWLLDNPHKRDSMAISALKRVKSTSGWDNYGRQCLAMYKYLIDRK